MSDQNTDKEIIQPAIRFKGFTDSWEQRKLNELTERVIRKNHGLASQRPLTISATHGLVDQLEFFNKYVSGSDLTEYYLIKRGEFAYNRSTSKDAPWGAVKRLNAYENGALSTLYIVFKLGSRQSIDSDFLSTYYDSFHWYRGISQVSAEGARSHGLLNIQVKDFFASVVPHPRENQEQRRIGLLFTRLNTALTLQQRKLELLKELKKSLLAKMFPSGDSDIPQIRFSGFTDPWEQRKLGEVAKKISDKNTSMEYSEVFTNSAEHGIIRQTDYFDKAIANVNNTATYYIVRPDDFVYNPRISTLAPFGPIRRNLLKSVGIMSPLYFVFCVNGVENQFLDAYFISTGWHSFMRNNGDTGARSDRLSIKDSVFTQMPIHFPGLEEQQFVGTFFKHLGTAVTLQQRKLELLKELKKSLLKAMFV